jgi:hypothetical protein
MSWESIQKIFEEEREKEDEGWIDRFDNSRIYDEEREEYNRDEPSDSNDKWEEIGFRLEDEWEGVGIEQVLQEGPSPQGDSLCSIWRTDTANQRGGQWMGADKNSSWRRWKLQQDEHGFQTHVSDSLPKLAKPT